MATVMVLPSRHRIVLVSSPKGGVGKTTVSLNLLVCGAQAGYRCLGIDLDPQRNLEKWFRRRPQQQVVRPDIVGMPIDGWMEALEGAKVYDLVIVDTPPSVEDHMVDVRELAERADLVLIPTGYGPFDLDSVVPWMAAMDRHGLNAAFCMNRVNRRARAFRTAQQRLVKVGKLCPVEIPQLEEILSYTARGLTVLDIEKAKGIEDIEAVWDFVRREIRL